MRCLIEEKIEDLRFQMVDLSEKTSLDAIEVIIISQQLDCLLNEYYLLCAAEEAESS